MTEKPQFELKPVEGDDSPDDVIVPVNLSKLIDLLIAKEEAERATRDKESSRKHIEAMIKETFKDGD